MLLVIVIVFGSVIYVWLIEGIMEMFLKVVLCVFVVGVIVKVMVDLKVW